MKDRVITDILKQEIQCSMGCTEPSALAYAVAYSNEQLKEKIKKINVRLSSNVLKNALCVNIPNTNVSGIELIILLAIISCESEDKLTILKNVSSDDLKKVNELKSKIDINIELVKNVNPLFIDVELYSDNHVVNTIVEENHKKIKSCRVDDEYIYQDKTNNDIDNVKNNYNYNDILLYVKRKKYDKKLLDEVIKYNVEISEYGLENRVGLKVGYNINNSGIFNKDYSNIISKTVAGIDARMSGAAKKVFINSGSGNQGITATVPIVEMAKKLKVSDEVLYSSLTLSHCTTIYIRSKQNKLSSSCGAVCACAGVAAGITYMLGGTDDQIKGAVLNLLCSNFGIFCDGAKVTCSFKIASSISAALISASLAKNEIFIHENYGVISSSFEDTLKNLSKIEKEFTNKMDESIMNVAIKNKKEKYNVK